MITLQYLRAILFSLPLGFFLSSNAAAQNTQSTAWVLPLTLNDDNTEVRYQYHAFGRQNFGRSEGIRGKVWLATSDLRSIKASIEIPSPRLDMLGSASFSFLGELLKTAQLPAVIVLVDQVPDLCPPTEIVYGKPCAAAMEGQAQFGSFIHPLRLPVRIERRGEYFIVEGRGDLDAKAASNSVSIARALDSAEFSFTIKIPT